MSGVDVSALKAGQRVRVTYEGVLIPGGRDHLYVNGSVCVRSSTGEPAVALVAVEVLAEAPPAWLSIPGEAVRETRTGFVWVCDADKWSRSGSGQSVSDKTMAQQIAAGLVVHLVPEPTP